MSLTVEQLPEPILVVGGYGYRNVGDEAILAGLLARLDGRRVTVVSRDPDATRRLHGVAAVGIRGAVAALPRHRSVVIGGGGLFGRDMGVIGRLLPVFGIVASALGHVIIVEGVDLDADLARSARALVPRLMRRATRVTLRDRRSVAVLDGWGVRANLAPDLSAWMPMGPVAAGRAVLRAAGVDTRRPVVGLALTGVDRAQGEAALASLAAVMDALPATQFCFLPMSRHPRVSTHDDLVLARRLQQLRPRLAIVDTDGHPSTVLAAFAQLSAVVAMRYHAMLFAERAGVPLVPIAYAEKNLRWLEERGREPIPLDAASIVAALGEALVRDERTAPPVRSVRSVTGTAETAAQRAAAAAPS